MTATHLNDFVTSEAGPSRPGSSRSTSPIAITSRKPFYPVWPDSHDDAEYFEIPPDHFLAQQRGPYKQQSWEATSPLSERSFGSLTPSSSASAGYVIYDVTSQPLSELASAIQSGIPAAPGSTGFAPLDTVPRLPGFSTINQQIPDTSTLAAADFDVDVRSGFLPPEQPVLRLNGEHETQWEHALDEAKRIPLKQGGGGVKTTQQQRLQAQRWRRSIREMPVLPLSHELANDIRYARRGHVVLSFLAHFYIHSQPRKQPQPAHNGRSWLGLLSRKASHPTQAEQDHQDELSGEYARRLPASIAVPWVQLSHKLDLPPVLTYATSVLWNWAYIDPAGGLEPDNLRITETFTGTKSEEHFFLTSLLIEARGVEALDLMRASLDEAFVGDRTARRRIAFNLNRLAVVLQDLSKLLHDVRTECDPKVFYWGIRPWFVGSDTVDKDEQPGWQFEGVDPEGERRTHSGPSAGQSSMIHAIDVFLDVDHSRSKERPNRPSAQNGENQGTSATFMERMQQYMPGHHRAFLTHLRSISFDDEEDEDEREVGSVVLTDDGDETAEPLPPSHPIRSLAIKAKDEVYDEGLPAAYDNAIKELKALRDEHMKIAYLYIVSQARGSPPDEYASLSKGFTGETDSKKQGPADSEQSGGAKGTGGTDLVSFLKDCRVNTVDTLLSATSTANEVVNNVVLTSTSSNAEAPTTGQSLPLPSPTSANQPSPGVTLESRDRQTDSHMHSGLQIWAINIRDWTPESDAFFTELVSQLLPGDKAAADRAKVMRYYRQIDRTRSLVARLLPRLMLRQLFGFEWDDVTFATTAEGRPFVQSPSMPRPTDFNISHDTDWVVMAFSTPTSAPAQRVGVDVMSLQLPKYESSVRSFAETMDMAMIPAEVAWVLAPLSTKESEAKSLSRLYKLWTYKEAFTKNIGKGLGFDFTTVHFAFDHSDHQGILHVHGEAQAGYQFTDILLPGSDSASQLVVCEGPAALPFANGKTQFSPQLSATAARQTGLLHLWTLAELLDKVAAAR